MKRITIIVALLLVIASFPTITGNNVNASSNKIDETLMITHTPSVLTAGVVPELVDPSDPFTLYVSDQNGNPIDLTNSGVVEDENVWNSLFVDPHPDELPQYYWTRLDLHNDDATDVCNETLFPHIDSPIDIDFSRAHDGIYIFNGFCANDKGEFDIIVYTPDRKHYGMVTVVVESPNIDYAIWNTEDPALRIFHTPGDPDFVMTAADNRIYGLKPTVRTADGKLIKGIASEISSCNNYSEPRVTIATTTLANFFFNNVEEEVAHDPISNRNIKYISNMKDRYWINLGVDKDNDGKIEIRNKEIYDIAYFNVHYPNDGLWSDSGYKTFYNTTCTRWDDGTFQTGYLFEYDNTEVGWGMGCIYNSPYLGCYLLPDFDDNGILNHKDSLSLDNKGQTEYYIFANDVCGVTMLLGVNPYGDVDLAGGGPSHEEDPKYVERRYKPDGTFKLDMDAFVKHSVSSGSTTVSRITARINLIPEKPEVGLECNCRVVVTRIEDNRPVMGVRVQLSGAGVLEEEKTDENGIVNFTFTPTESSWVKIHVQGGTDLGTVSSEFRVGKDRTPPPLKLDDSIPTLTNENFISISGTTEAGGSVFVDGEEVEVSKNGRFSHKFELGEGTNTINVKAEDPSGNATRKSLTITLDSIEPYIKVDPIDDRYIEARMVNVNGRVDEDCTIRIDGVEELNPVMTSSTFSFSVPVTYGDNTIKVVATDPAGNTAFEEFQFVNFKRTTIIMKIGSIEFLVNGKRKELRFAPFIESETTMVPVRAISESFDATVDYDSKTRSIEITLGEIQVLLQIGVPHMVVSGEKKTLAVPPLIKNDSTFVPLRAISEAFNSDIDWAPESKEITIERLFIP